MTPQHQSETEIAVLSERMGNVEEALTKILHHIEGNGKKGLLERMVRLEFIATVAIWAGGIIGSCILTGACWGVWLIVKKVVFKA